MWCQVTHKTCVDCLINRIIKIFHKLKHKFNVIIFIFFWMLFPARYSFISPRFPCDGLKSYLRWSESTKKIKILKITYLNYRSVKIIPRRRETPTRENIIKTSIDFHFVPWQKRNGKKNSCLMLFMTLFGRFFCRSWNTTNYMHGKALMYGIWRTLSNKL